jgi:hypothetical protein
MKQSAVIESARINALAKITERTKTRQLTDYGRDMRRVYGDICDMLHVGYPNMGGIEYRVTCQSAR